MVYPGNFHRLVLIGSLYAEDFNTSLSIVPRASSGTIGLPPVADLLTPLASVLSTWWSSSNLDAGNLRMNSFAKLESFKLNTIGPDGKYVENVTYQHTYTTPVSGNVSMTIPPQLAAVVTLRTAATIGLASKGRMYLPCPDGWQNVDPDGRLPTSVPQRLADSMKNLFDGINAVYAAQESGDESLGRVGVASDRVAGQFREVTHITVGRVVDTMRSRRASLVEDPLESAALA